MGMSIGNQSMSCGTFNDLRAFVASQIGINLFLMEGYTSKEALFMAKKAVLEEQRALTETAKAQSFVKDSPLTIYHFNRMHHFIPDEPMSWESVNTPLKPFFLSSDTEVNFSVEECEAMAPELRGVFDNISEETVFFRYDAFKRLVEDMEQAVENKVELT